MSIDKYRRKAKFAAWYDDPDDEDSGIPFKNPFRKYRATSRSKPDDLNNAENGDLRREQTEDLDYDQTDRRNELVGTSPAHANTMPFANFKETCTTDLETGQVGRSDSPIQEEEAKLPRGGSNENDKKDSGSTSETVRETELGGTNDDTTRNRKVEKNSIAALKDKILHHKGSEHDEKEDADPSGKQKQTFTAVGQFRATVLNSWINILFIASPIGIATYYAHVNPVAVFVINFIAIIPLAAMLSYATEEIALRTGEVLGGLLNASFGNAVELIVSIIALTQNQILIVQTSLIGSMLSNLLLVMGMCFFFGGFNRIEQEFNMTVAQTASSLLFLAVAALIIPTAFQDWSSAATVNDTKPGVAELSRGTSIMLLIVYACYLFFQLKSHSKMYQVKLLGFFY
jgi:Ca2+:H+ antiporter